MKKEYLYFLIILLIFMPEVVLAKRGCCSHHGGVYGCSSSGRQVCNDGTLSPSCTCTSSVTTKKVSTYVNGCTDKEAKNYNSRAEKDDGSCKYITESTGNDNSGLIILFISIIVSFITNKHKNTGFIIADRI